jgi:hypothetical protein
VSLQLSPMSRGLVQRFSVQALGATHVQLVPATQNDVELVQSPPTSTMVGATQVPETGSAVLVQRRPLPHAAPLAASLTQGSPAPGRGRQIQSAESQ